MQADRLAATIAALGLLLRLWVPAPSAGTGVNLFLNLLPFAGLACWTASRALAGGGRVRFTTFEGPLLALALLGAGSVLNASYRLPALEAALGYASLGALVFLLAQTFERRGVLELLLPALAAILACALLQRLVLFPLLEAEAARTSSVELARRIRTNEVFGTFGGPNQLAGFLALTLPIVAGSLLDDPRGRAVRAVLLLLGLVVLALTGSLGGAVALGFGALAFAALAWKRGAWVAGIGILGALVLCAGPMPAALQKSHSLHVRSVYWDATRAMITRAPFLGVGLDQWQEHYFELKSDVPQESRKAHNDYLQILAELGIPGLLALLLLLGLGLRAGLRPHETAEEPSKLPPPLLLAGLGLLGVYFCGMSGEFIAPLLAGVWWLGHRLLRGQPFGPWTRIGATAGLAAFMAHLLVDYDFNEAGTAAALGAVLACLGGGLAKELPRRAAIVATLLLAAVLLPLLLWTVPAALAADQEFAEALRRPADAVRLLEAARGHNPLNAEIPRSLALLRRSLADVDAAIALQPRSSPLHHLKAQILREQGRKSEAVAAQRRALELYPTYAGNPYALARLLDGEEAKRHYAEALRLGEKAGAELENLDRLKLGPVARARALRALGRPDEARRALEEPLRDLVRGAAPEEARRRLDTWKGLIADERDEVMSPVIQELLDAIIRDLK